MKARNDMKKLLALLIALILAASVVACSKSETPASTAGEKEPATEAATEEVGVKDVLSFIEKDEIYFDIHLTEGLFDKTSVKVGDKVLTESGKAPYTGNEEIVFEGKSDKDTDINLIIISLTKGEKAMTDYSIVEASELPEMITKRIPIDKKGKDKVLVIVTDTKDGYDHSFDSALSDIIKIALSSD